MYTKEQLIELNPSYNFEHRLTDKDVATVNELVEAIQAKRAGEPVVTEGDIIICVSPEKGVVSDHGHLEHAQMGEGDDGFSICVHSSIPFINKSLVCDTSGGYWMRVYGSDVPNFVFKGKRIKTFKVWGHFGPTANGTVSFQAEVNVWEWSHPKFY